MLFLFLVMVCGVPRLYLATVSLALRCFSPAAIALRRAICDGGQVERSAMNISAFVSIKNRHVFKWYFHVIGYLIIT